MGSYLPVTVPQYYVGGSVDHYELRTTVEYVRLYVGGELVDEKTNVVGRLYFRAVPRSDGLIDLYFWRG